MDGLLLCDKPPGRTSHDVVAAVRRALPGRRRVGHAGTLDPFATGLLVVLVGRATRAQRYVMGLPKTYEVLARFGAVSTTGDPDGELTETGRVPDGDLALPTGVLRQRPPAYSAVKVGGRRAYSLARAGEEVELPERDVVVHRFEEVGRDGPLRRFVVECSAGTYVRSLVADLGDAYCQELRRTAIGPFRLADAASDLDDPAAHLIALGEGLAFLPRVELAGEDAVRAGHGVAIAGESDGPVLLCDAQGPVAIAEPRDGGLLKPVVGFRA